MQKGGILTSCHFVSNIAISTLIFCNIVARGLLIYFYNMRRNERRPRGQPRARPLTNSCIRVFI